MADTTVYGWTIDDVAVTGVPFGGSINISKNLGQGTYTLSSLTSLGLVPVQTGTEPSVTISNLPAGQYVVQFGDVDYYVTPVPQTNTLALGGILNFNGNYTFVDVNHNGISDEWERDYFGTVSANRTSSTDTDGNGMTDYAKFIAGLNPTNPAAVFKLTGATNLGSGVVQLTWPVVTNRLYQINGSSSLTSWSPMTDWLQASNSPTMSCTITNNGTGARFYRLQVQQ